MQAFSFFLIFFLGCVIVAIYLLRWFQRQQAQDALMWQPIPRSEDTYTLLPKRIQEEKTRYDQTKASTDDKKVLASALMKRAMGDVAVIMPFERAGEGIVRAKQKGFVPDSDWIAFIQAQQFAMAESVELRGEAEFLREGWGEVIIAQAVQLVLAGQQRQMEQEEKQRQEKERLRAQVQAEKQKQAEEQEKKLQAEKQAKQAEKIAQQLIQEEQNQKKKTK